MTGFKPGDDSYKIYKQACKTVDAALSAKPSDDPKLDDRMEFYLRVLDQHQLLKKGTCIADLGGGSSWFIVVLAQMGLNANLVDDFWGGGHVETTAYRTQVDFLEKFEKLGVKVHSQDLLAKPLPMPDKSVDVVTCFHTLEHYHNSPKKLFAEIQRVLRPGGYIFFATPNVVNLRKRAYCLLGRNPFDNLDEWYQHEIFRGHVREPSIADLHQMYRWNGFRVVDTYGRNFIGRDSIALSFLPRPVTRLIGRTSSAILQLFPSLCSDIHVVGVKQ